MITNIIFMVGLVLFAAFLAKVVDLYRYKGKVSAAQRMSFRETLDLTDLPIVTFKHKGKKINFLLDTGASNSVINKSVLEHMDYTNTGKFENIYGIDGTIQDKAQYVNFDIEYKDTNFNEDFQAIDLSKAFGNIKADKGVNLHGILGNSFLSKYRYIIDFNELVAYSVK